jgi:hypothetical protein
MSFSLAFAPSPLGTGIEMTSGVLSLLALLTSVQLVGELPASGVAIDASSSCVGVPFHLRRRLGGHLGAALRVGEAERDPRAPA